MSSKFAFKKAYPTILEMMDDFGYSWEQASNVKRVKTTLPYLAKLKSTAHILGVIFALQTPKRTE